MSATPGRGPLSLAAMLRFDVIQRADPVVVAGADQLERAVRWVHISEQPDIAAYLRGGEVLLTTGQILQDDPEAQRTFVRDLVAAQVTGVLIRPSAGAARVPQELVAEAERCALPVVVLRRRVGFVDITEAVHGTLLDRQLDLLRQAESLSRRFSEAVIRGQPLADLLGELAVVVARPVALEDAWGQVVETAWRGHDADAVLQRWAAQHAHVTHDEKGPGRVHHVPGVCSSITITLRGSHLGRIHVLADGLTDTPPLDEAGCVALEEAAAAVALALLTERDARSLAEYARGALMADLLHGRIRSGAALLRRARSVGVPLSGRPLIGLAVVCAGLPEFAAAHRLPEVERQAIVDGLRFRTQELIRPWAEAAIIATDEGQVVGLVEPRVDAQSFSRLEATAEALHQAATARWGPPLSVVVGVSNEHDPSDAGRALQEARKAVDYGARVRSPARLHRYGDLGIYRLLHLLAEEGRLSGFVYAELGPLLDHDGERRADLLSTLETYLSHGARGTETARALFIERRTLYHRLRLIEELLDRRLDDHDTRLRLAVALRGLALLRD